MPKGNILVVEDSKVVGSKTKMFLEKSGYQVTWVVEGLSAFRVAKSESIDVILLDRVLPDMDGITICRLLKQDEATKTIPIIMLTAMNTTEEKVKGLEAGADDYLPKPYEDVELNARVYAALRTKQLSDELRRKNDALTETLAKVETLSVTDPLTGLFNRRRFEEVLDLEFKKSSRYHTPLSLMMIDIDHFKSVNDTYGHAVGDGVIKEVALIIKQSIRDADLACRWGGEEFIVLAPMTPKAGALLPARRILSSVCAHDFTGLGGEKKSVSIGIADVSGNGIDTAMKLIQAADAGMYEAKKKGRNRIEVQE